jgi:hypothetical protein
MLDGTARVFSSQRTFRASKTIPCADALDDGKRTR